MTRDVARGFRPRESSHQRSRRSDSAEVPAKRVCADPRLATRVAHWGAGRGSSRRAHRGGEHTPPVVERRDRAASGSDRGASADGDRPAESLRDPLFAGGRTFCPLRRDSGTMTQSLAELEQLCNVLYNSHNPNERAHAEGVLRPFSTNPEYIPQCKVRTPSRVRWFFFARAHPFNNTRRRSSRGRGGRDRGTAALLARSSRHARERRSGPASPAFPPPHRPAPDARARPTRERPRGSKARTKPETDETRVFFPLSFVSSKRFLRLTKTRRLRVVPHARRLSWTARRLRTRSSSRRRR